MRKKSPTRREKKRLARSVRHPSGGMKDFCASFHAPTCSVESYARTLETLRQASRERPSGIPVHFVLDQEGNGSENYTVGDVPLWPCPMGLTATGNPEFAYRAARTLGADLRAGGIDWIHSPTLDVNTNPRNPEIGTRAYGTEPNEVREYAEASWRGFHDAGIIATGKHFPGRGASDKDSHLDLPVIGLDADVLRKEHVAPFAALIKAGLPAVMIAHTVYPAFDPDRPATTSPALITGLLKTELEFPGVVTTDNMLMGGIVTRHSVPEAALRAIQAGADLLLIRSETGLCDEVFETLLNAARNGEVPEERLLDANRRVLTLKARFGLLPTAPNPTGRAPGFPAAMDSDPRKYELEKEIAAAAMTIKGSVQAQPLDPESRVLVVEQVHHTHTVFNTDRCHPSIFWRRMLDYFPRAMNCEITAAGGEDFQRVLRRLGEADAIVITNWVQRRASADMSDFGRRVRREAGNKPFIVVTNSPFEFGSPADFDDVINVFSANPESLGAAAAVLAGPR